MPKIELDYTLSLAPEYAVDWSDLTALEAPLKDISSDILSDWKQDVLPFLSLPEQTTTFIKERAHNARQRFDQLVVLGIGGSSLGARAVIQAVSDDPSSVLFSENVDPDQFSRLLQQVNWEKTQWNVITKSGSTIETWSTFLIVREELIKRFGEEGARERILVTTDPEHGPLRRFAQEHQLDSLDVPHGVGGRFSGLSPVGLYPAAFAGVDIEQLLDGAKSTRDRCLVADVLESPAAVLAAIQILHYFQGRSSVVFMPYASALTGLSEWFCQLWAESLGKRKGEKRVGPTPIAALGVRDQHSQLQLYMEGPQDKILLFLEPMYFNNELSVPRSQVLPKALQHLSGKPLGEILRAELAGTRQALAEEGCPSLTLGIRALNASAIGSLMMLLEISTAFAGGLLGIDPYNQPGVELGKRFAHGLLGRSKEAHYASKLKAAFNKLVVRTLKF